MKELKRLSTGFLSAVMILSFILMPIPQTNRAWAASGDDKESECDQHTAEYPGESLKEYNDKRRKKDQITQAQFDEKKVNYDKYTGKNGVYKPGCEMTDAMSKASLDNPALYKDGKISQLIEQYLMGLFALTLINGLKWSYRYEANPVLYGKDCPSNWGPKWTIPITMLSGLTYVIGDAQANIRFKIAAKKATDEKFALKGRKGIPGADSKEVAKAQEEGEVDPRIQAVKDNNAQEDAYRALINVMKAQYAAVKTKKNLTRVSNLGYYTAAGLELTNLLLCNGQCAKDQAMAASILGKATAMTPVIVSQLTAAAAASMGTTAATCSAAIEQHAAALVKLGIDVSKIKGFESVKIGENIAESGDAMNGFEKAMESIRKLFSNKMEDAQATKNLSKILGESAKEVSKKSAKMSVETKKITAFSGTLASLDALSLVAKTCNVVPMPFTFLVPPLAKPLTFTIDAVGAFVTNYQNYLLFPARCCGGEGISMATYGIMDKKITAGAVNNPAVLATWSTMKAEMAKMNAKAPISDTPISAGIVANYTFPPGTFIFQGPPTKSNMEMKQDISIGGLFSKSSSFEDPKMKKLMKARVEYTKIVLRSALENLLLNSYSDDLMRNPKLYIKTVAENNIKLDQIMDYFNKVLSKDLNKYLIDSNYAAVQDIMKKFTSKVTSILVPTAHAGLGLAMGGQLMKIVGNQFENPWIKEIFNLGDKLLTLQGVLGGIMKDYALNRPVTRNITWALFGGIGEFVIASLKNTMEKIDKNLRVVQTELKRYQNSAATRTGLSGGARGGNTGATLQKYDPSASRTNSMQIKACAVPKGDGFAPAMCPSVIPKQKFSLPEISHKAKNHLTPDFLKGMSMLSDYSYAASTGSLSGDSMSDSDLAGIEQVSKAMASHNAILRAEIDKHNESIKAKGKTYPTLSSKIASFKKIFGGGASSSSGNLLGGAATSSPYRGGRKETVNNVTNVGKKKNAGGSGGSVAATKAPSFDLDFGDDEAGGIVNADGTAVSAAGAKGPEKLEDFVIQHDDINKRKEIPIWKILSNRYILSYPKILDEEDAKLAPDKVDKKKK